METAGAVQHAPPYGPWCSGSCAALRWYLTFQVVRKKMSNVGMKWAFLNAPWDFICLFCHRVALFCSPGEEEAVQSGDLRMPLVSQDGHAMTHALALT